MDIIKESRQISKIGLALIIMFFSILQGYSASPWFQFNDGYQIVKDTDSDIVPVISTSFSGEMLGSVLEFSDTGDRIASEFSVRESGEYKIELVSYTGYLTPDNPYARLDRTNVYVDGELLEKSAGSETDCQVVWGWYYCPFTVSKTLSSGSHKIEIESVKSRLRIDRYRYEKSGGSDSFDDIPDYTSSWFNFEDSYSVEKDLDNDIYVIYSSDFISEMDGAILHLGDTEDKISYDFNVDNSGEYKIEIFSYTAYKNPSNPYERLARTSVYLDGVEQHKVAGNSSSCQTVWDWQYCNYFVFTNLDSGMHELSIESNNAKLRLDRFRYHTFSGTDFSWQLVQEDTIPIFGYHNIIDDNEAIIDADLDIRKSDFINQIEYAQNVLGCRWYTLADITENYISQDRKTPENACVITFDDGKLNQYDNAVPYLNDNNIPATFYVVNHYASSGYEGYMDWEHIKELYDAGHEIGSHNFYHESLTSIPLSDARSNILSSKQDFNSRGFDVSTFAYPFGDDNKDVNDMVKDAGFVAARDVDKDNPWRRQVASTVNAKDADFIFKLNYFKPEELSNYDLEKDFNYNSWWQFEENNDVDKGTVQTLSSVDPYDTPSYAILRLYEGSMITSGFYTYNSGEYKIEVFSSTGEYEENEYLKYMDHPKIYVDGVERKIVPTENIDEDCFEAPWDWAYCSYYIYVDLEKGYHEISLEAANGEVRADMFRLWEKMY